MDAQQLLQMLKDCMRFNSDLIGSWHGSVQITIKDKKNEINHNISCWPDEICPCCDSDKRGYPSFQDNGGITGITGPEAVHKESTGTRRVWRCRDCHNIKLTGPTGPQG
jgi:hypothetical protein